MSEVVNFMTNLQTQLSVQDKYGAHQSHTKSKHWLFPEG